MVEMAIWSKITSISSTNTTTCSSSSASDHNPSSNCCGLSRLMRKLKKQRKMLCSTSRQSSFQCRYDPMSYSLNFDTTGSGSIVDEDYYKFYAFSSRFVATTPRNDCQRLVSTSH
ncbi:uncharacterized protein LOC113783703 [Coffea eugenioides]|uniref:Uncharacterized protein n=1 Tax=Coffea arabica TaxID=13443 RepID=A0A6P6UBJ2_COFAR|nr:uncharacterized protein LOC113709541 [Coffea arabica]XP_027185712.1 uncharacterized protein LOC113783703 [Coffea eugenioides]